MKTVNRIMHDEKLIPLLAKLKGRVLDVGSYKGQNEHP